MIEIITGRLHLRPVSIDDKDSMYSYRADPETNKYLSLIPKSVEDVAEFIGKTSVEVNVPGTWYQLVIIQKDSGVLIGDIGIHFLDNSQVEIGYTLDKQFRGKGYGTEALRKVIDYLLNNLNKHRIIASIDPTNEKSIRLIERLGFRKEAHFVESLFFQGKWVDELVYAILAREWNNGGERVLNFN